MSYQKTVKIFYEPARPNTYEINGVRAGNANLVFFKKFTNAINKITNEILYFLGAIIYYFTA